MLPSLAMNATRMVPDVLIPQPRLASSSASGAGHRDPRDIPHDDIHFVCVLKGAFLFLADLVRAMDGRRDPRLHRRLQLRRRHQILRRSAPGEGRRCQPRGRHVVIVEDIVDTGLTLHYLQDILRRRGPKSLRTACLLSKPSRRKVDVEGGVRRLHHRGPLRRRLRPRLRRAVPQPAVRRRDAVAHRGSLHGLPHLGRRGAASRRDDRRLVQRQHHTVPHQHRPFTMTSAPRRRRAWRRRGARPGRTSGPGAGDRCGRR
jgi:hypoxanthine phosphoribosyltransferase